MSEHDGPNAPLPEVESVDRTFHDVNQVSLHTITAGDPDDPPVVLLHGFPEFWYGWHEYIGRFADAGYRVIVPDQRGYNRSDKPDGVRPYRLTRLSRDIVSLIDAEGHDSAHVIGHDWGAAVAWDLALRHPESVDRLGIINVPHPTVFVRTLRSNLTQLRKSWYMFFFQLPRLPEWYARRDDFDAWVSPMREPSRPDAFSETDFERYRRAWSESRAPTAMINWYRAVARYPDEPPRDRVQTPTLVIWGENDQALVPEMASKSVEYCEPGELEQFSDATHWINHEEPNRVSELLVEHLEA